MNKVLVIFCTLLLAGCGSDDDKKTTDSTNAGNTGTQSISDIWNDMMGFGDGVKPTKPLNPIKPVPPTPKPPADPKDPVTPEVPDKPDKPEDDNIVGIWDKTRDLGSLGVDEFYVAIDEDGYVSTYDYDGDTYDRGHNCYFVEKDILQIKGSGGSYQFIYAYTDDVLSVDLTIENDQLDFTSLEDNEELKFKKDEKRTFGKRTSDLYVKDFENLACEYK